MHTYRQTHIQAGSHTNMPAGRGAHIQTYRHIYRQKDRHAGKGHPLINTYIHTYIHTYITHIIIHTCIHAYVYTYIQSYRQA